VLVPHVGDIHAQAALDVGDVEQVAAVLGHQAVHRGHACAKVQQSVRQIRANKSEPSGDQNSLVHEGGLLHI
jgi:hypothetical protein